MAEIPSATVVTSDRALRRFVDDDGATLIGSDQAAWAIIARLVRDNCKVGGHLIGDWLGRLRNQRVDSRAPGQGGVVRHNGKIIGACRDQAGAVHAVSLTRTHLGCTVRWNASETTWDCPCHGSRFDHTGPVQGPAVRDLRRFDVSSEER